MDSGLHLSKNYLMGLRMSTDNPVITLNDLPLVGVKRYARIYLLLVGP